MTEGQKLVSTLNRFELENFEKLWLTQKMLQTDRLTNTALTLLVTNMTEGQKLISTLSRFELENIKKLWLTQKTIEEVENMCYRQTSYTWLLSATSNLTCSSHIYLWVKKRETVQKLLWKERLHIHHLLTHPIDYGRTSYMSHSYHHQLVIDHHHSVKTLSAIFKYHYGAAQRAA